MLLDIVRSMMSRTELPLSFWRYALETAIFTLNRVPTKFIDKIPYEVWTVRVPTYFFLKIWGCKTFVRRLMPNKFGPKFDKYLFIGYPSETKGYYFYHRPDNKVFVVRHDVFMEEEILSKENSGSKVTLEEIQDPLFDASGQIEVEQVSDETKF
jgi:hypothetical protein